MFSTFGGKMRLLKNFLMGVGGLGLLICAGLLVAPTSLRAVAATLVQVTNTAAAPAITQDVSKLSSQSTQFWCPFSFVGCFNFPGVNTVYTVPAGKTLVITSVDFAWQGTGAPTGNFYSLFCGTSLTLDNTVGEWSLTGGAGPLQYTYPSGLTVPGGCTINVSSYQQSNYDTIVRGYLTSN
jgi:hypothetical protein